MKEKGKMPDAPESSAGDDFHVLWAMRKSLELFNFKDEGLKALTIEGSAIEDAKIVDPDGDLLLGVDVGEYFGGENFEDATLLQFTQLKYSTRHPNQPWTTARICQGKKSGHSGSIIHRLATICETYLDKFGEAAVREKLRLKLVSNRPATEEIIDLVNNVKEIIKKLGMLPSFTQLKISIDAKHNDFLEKIKTASQLPAKHLSLFISLLDFSDCGAGARQVLKEDTIRSINKVNSISQIENYNTLHVKIWHKMMPESRSNNKLTIIDMLDIFNVGSEAQLFPVPAVFEKQDSLVHRVQLEDIVQKIKSAGALPICLHAGAGMGKSSVIQQLKKELPNGSVVIMFDCYGGGSYLDPDDARHKPEWALKQIANQMALAVGSDFFLLPAGQSTEIYYRDFRLRLKTAVEILRDTNPDALLVIVIDAADNSVTAATQKGEHSFVLDIVKLPLPDGCKIVVTTRSYRLAILQLPDNVLIELKPFTKEETLARLELIFPNITEEQSLVFHKLTKGIPRVQTYALVNSNAGIEAIMEPLKPSGKELDQLMYSNISEVTKKLGDPEKVNHVLKTLIALPRPISVAALADLAGTNSNVILDIVTDIGQGILLNNNTLSLTDEDFEDYLDRTYPSNDDIHKKIADYFLSKATSDAYASRHLGNVLRLAGHYDKLKEIVFNGQYLAVPEDPVVLKEMVIERTRAAMALSIAENNPVDFLKLQVVAAEAATTNDLLEQILLANADLSALYGESQTIEKLLHADILDWYAPVHFRCAAVYARNKETLVEAKEHYKAASSWMDWGERQTQKEFQNYQLSPEDFVFAAEATCRLKDTKSALEFLHQYNYPRFGSSSMQFLRHMLIVAPKADVDKVVKSFELGLRGKLNITRAYFKNGSKSPIDIDAIVPELLDSLGGRKFILTKGRSTILEVAEYLSWQQYNPEAIQQLLNCIIPKSYGQRFYASYIGFNKDLDSLDLSFKIKCLLAACTEQPVTISDFYNDKIRSVDPQRYSHNDSVIEERQRADLLFGSVLQLFLARARYLFGKLDEPGLFNAFEDFRENIDRNHEIYRYHRELPNFYLHYASVFRDLGLYVTDKAAFCKILIKSFDSSNNSIITRLNIASSFSYSIAAYPEALKLLNEASKMIFNEETSARIKIDNYLRCVRIGARLDDLVARVYFKKLIDTVDEMDLEGFDQVRFIGELAKSFEGRYPKASFDYSRFTQFAYNRLKDWDHFPLRESIAGIGSLDHFGVWATLARWDHQNLIEANDYLLTASESALQKDLLHPATHATFLVIASLYPDEFTRQLNLLISKAAYMGQKALSALGNTFYRIVRFECVHYRINDLLHELKSALESAECNDSALMVLVSSYRTLDEENPKKSMMEPVKNLKKKSLTDIPAIDLSDIAKVQNVVREWVDINQRPAVDFFVAIRSQCRIGQYLDFLTMIIELEDEILNPYDRERLLEDTFESWKDHPALPEWKTLHFIPFLQHVFPAYTEHRTISNTSSLNRIAHLFGANEKLLTEGVKQLLAKNIERLDARMIYELGSITKTDLTEKQKLDVIEWVLQRWIAKIPDTGSALQWDDKFLVPNDSQKAAAGLLRYFLGHPRKKERWRVLNALRLSSRMGDNSLVSILLADQDKKQIIPFQHEPFTYYWISAKLWLWMLMKKLADEQTIGMKEFAEKALQTLKDKELPHSLIHYHVQQFCLALEHAFPGTFTVTQLQIVNAALQPLNNQKKKKENSKLPRNKSKFDFDRTDTLPYWYDPLGDVFDVSSLAVANYAEHFIRNIWGYTGKPHEDNHVKVDDHSYYLTTNNHGEIPEIEILRLYYEFHAMFCAASELLNRAPKKSKIAKSFKKWLERWNTTFDVLWLSDLRDTTPVDAVFNTPNRSSDWQEKISDEYLASFLQTKDNWITVDANIQLIYGSEQERVSINSALVTDSNGMSLLYALQEMPLHAYKLPEEDENYHEIDENGFMLKGWYSDISGRDEVHDRLDPLANKLNNSYLRLGRLFMNWGRFKLASDFRSVTNSKGEIVAFFENWDDSTEHPDFHQLETKGQRLSVMPIYLLKFLQKHNYSLIIEVKVDRDENRRSYRDDKNRLDIEQKNIYIIEADGTVKSNAGDFKIR